MVKTRLISFEIDQKVNLDHPIAVDLLVIYDEELLKQILALPAADWFEKRSQFKNNYPRSLSTWEWELVPEPKSPQGALLFRTPSNLKKAKGIILFAKYLTPGEHRIRLDALESARVRLGEKEVVIVK